MSKVTHEINLDYEMFLFNLDNKVYCYLSIWQDLKWYIFVISSKNLSWEDSEFLFLPDFWALCKQDMKAKSCKRPKPWQTLYMV